MLVPLFLLTYFWSSMYVFILMFSLLGAGMLTAEPLLVDEIVAQVMSPEGNEIILFSDLIAGIDGQRKTLKELILEKLMVLDAKKYKIEVNEEELDRFLAQLLKQNSWSRSDFIMFLDEHGFTYEEGRDMLRSRQMTNQVIDYRVRSDKRMIVNREEAFQHYKAHPEVEEATYTLSIAYAPFATYAQDKLDALLKDDKTPENLLWDEPFTLKASELADDRKFIADRAVGSIVLVDKLEDGYELTKLVETTPAKELPFDDQYHMIVSKIRAERFETVFEGYRKELLEEAKKNNRIILYRKEFKLD